MIIINSRRDTITIPFVNKCNLPDDEKYYLLLKNTFTKDLFILKFYERIYDDFFEREHYQWIELKISLPDSFPYGEYEYYLTPDNLYQVIIDINDISYTESADIVMLNTECEKEIFRDIRIISTGILKFNDNPSYHERYKQTESEYTERN